VYENFVYSTASHTVVHKYDVKTGEKHQFAYPSSVVFSDDIHVVAFNDYVALAGFPTGMIWVWNCESHKFEYCLKVSRPITEVLSLVAYESCIVYGGSTGVVGICDFLKPLYENTVSEGVVSLSTQGTAFAPWQVLRCTL